MKKLQNMLICNFVQEITFMELEFGLLDLTFLLIVVVLLWG
jgi:hypothetical protein